MDNLAGKPPHDNQNLDLIAQQFRVNCAFLATSPTDFAGAIDGLYHWASNRGLADEQIQSIMEDAFRGVPDYVRLRKAKANGHDPAANLRFRLIPFKDLEPSTAANYCIKGFLPGTGVAVVWGPKACGKSFITFDAAMHIALGWEYRGHRTKQGEVVYCAFEGAEGFKCRAKAFRMHHGVGDAPLHLMPVVVDLIHDHKQFITEIELQCAKPRVVVLDTLNRSLFGNENEDMGDYFKAADAIRERFNCLVIIVHHCGVDGTRPRGPTLLTCNCEVQIAVSRDEARNVIASLEYMKDGPDQMIVASRLKVVEVQTDEDGDPMTSCVVEPLDKEPLRPPKGAKPPKGAAIAMDALDKCLAEMGVSSPASNTIPAGVSVVSVEDWRKYAYAMGISTGEERAQQKAFQLATQWLVGSRSVKIWQGYAWKVRLSELPNSL